jgi:hypothetical protein
MANTEPPLKNNGPFLIVSKASSGGDGSIRGTLGTFWGYHMTLESAVQTAKQLTPEMGATGPLAIIELRGFVYPGEEIVTKTRTPARFEPRS